MNYSKQWPSWEVSNPSASQKIMKPLGSLPCSQKPATFPNWTGRILSMTSNPLSLMSTLILSSHLCLSPKWYLSFRIRFMKEFLYLPHVLHAPSTLSNIWSGLQTCFPTKTVMLCFLPPHAWQSLVNIYREAQIMLFLVQFSPASCHFELTS